MTARPQLGRVAERGSDGTRRLGPAGRLLGLADRLTLARAALPLLALAGMCGTGAIALAAPPLVDEPSATWWYRGPVHAHALATALLYLGTALLVGAWIGLGHALFAGSPLRSGGVLAIAALWAAPLSLAPALFSHDLYSYFAQGTLYRLGADPYTTAPVALAHLGAPSVLAAVDPFWRHTIAPYGPSFIVLAGAISGVARLHLTAGVLALRGLSLVGLALVAIFLPRLVRHVGGDPRLALWLGVASPLALLQLFAAGHGDALMIGLMVAGLTLAYEGRLVPGVALLALATTVKLPAALVLVFVLVAVVRAAPGERRLLLLLGALGACAVVFVAISLGSGLGIGWLSRGVLATPGKVLLAITPASALAWCCAKIVHGLGGRLSARHLSTVLSDVFLAATALYGLYRLVRVTRRDLVPAAAAILLLAALLGPAAWPWYFAWGLTILAAGPGATAPLVIAGVCAAAFVVKPGGTLALPIQASPATLALYVLLGTVALVMWRRRARTA